MRNNWWLEMTRDVALLGADDDVAMDRPGQRAEAVAKAAVTATGALPSGPVGLLRSRLVARRRPFGHDVVLDR